MKTIIAIILALFAFGAFAQKETYEFVTYNSPMGWKKDVKPNTYTSFTTTNSQNNSYCQIFIMLSTSSKGGIKEDFESEWQNLIVKNYGVTDPPNLTEPTSDNGWTAKGGIGNFKFNNGNSIAMLTTMSGYSKIVSIIAVTNSQDYMPVIKQFLESVEMGKPQNSSNVVSANNNNTNNNSDNPSIIGTWKTNSSDQSSWRVNNGVMSTISRQYTFNENGSYTFYCKTFDPLMNNMILTKESGTYQISGNQITINPQKSVVESWTKKDGTDRFGKLVSSQNHQLEKMTYQFAKKYFSGIQQWNLLFHADKQTERDGPASSNDTFGTAWYYQPISANNQVIELP
jgi:hypothetical protein